MAIYEFVCDECGKEYEFFDEKSDPDAKRPCPECRKMNKKIISAPNHILKDGGCGWAKDGYSRRHSVADGPSDGKGNRFKKSGKTVVPVRNMGLSIEPDKDKSKKKKPTLAVKK